MGERVTLVGAWEGDMNEVKPKPDVAAWMKETRSRILGFPRIGWTLPKELPVSQEMYDALVLKAGKREDNLGEELRKGDTLMFRRIPVVVRQDVPKPSASFYDGPMPASEYTSDRTVEQIIGRKISDAIPPTDDKVMVLTGDGMALVSPGKPTEFVGDQYRTPCADHWVNPISGRCKTCGGDK